MRWVARRLGEARLDHPPADAALQRTQTQRDQETLTEAGLEGDALGGEEVCEGQRVGEADDATERAVAIFHVVDELELVQRHALVVQLVLGGLLVARELGLPLLLQREGEMIIACELGLQGESKPWT